MWKPAGGQQLAAAGGEGTDRDTVRFRERTRMRGKHSELHKVQRSSKRVQGRYGDVGQGAWGAYGK